MKSIQQTKDTALITGGSSGIGLAFARELAADGQNLVLVSRDDDLVDVARGLQAEFRVEVETIHVDLSHEKDLKKVTKRIESDKNPVDMVINCAGFVLRESLIDGDLVRQHKAFAVMAEAVMVLSQTAAQVMRQRGSGQIINIASTSAWFYNGNYSALKRWVVVYTESLALELRGSGVSATVVCPGETQTNFHARGGVTRSGPMWLWCTPDKIARAGLRAAAKGKSIVVPTVRWRLIAWTMHHFQGLARTVSRKTVTSRLKEIKQRDGHH